MTAKTDRELLELAARACDMPYWDHYDESNVALLAPTAEDGVAEEWDPLTDDGDAFRLAVKLSMSVEISEDETSTYAYAGDAPRAWAMELWRDDRYAATRRAIVRAAAAIGAKS